MGSVTGLACNRWHLDDMVVRIAGKHMYLWRAVAMMRARFSKSLFSAEGINAQPSSLTKPAEPIMTLTACLSTEVAKTALALATGDNDRVSVAIPLTQSDRMTPSPGPALST
jgi:hypothetical protein